MVVNNLTELYRSFQGNWWQDDDDDDDDCLYAFFVDILVFLILIPNYHRLSLSKIMPHFLNGIFVPTILTVKYEC